MPKPLFRILTKKVFLIANIIVALLFLLGCYAHHVFSVSLWFVGLLSLSAFYFLVILVLFVVFWILARSKWALLIVPVLAAGWLPVSKIIPFRMADDFSMAKSKGGLRVMSWNVAQFDILQYKKDPSTHDSMIALINEYQPDVACFQEMVAGDSIIDLDNKYYHKFAFYSILDFELALHFPDEYYSYNWKENYLSSQHFGIVTFSKYPIINRHTIAIYPNDYNSIFQFIDIVKGSDTLRVFNIHLQSLKFTPANLQYIDNPSIQSDSNLQKSKNIIVKLKKGFLRRQIQADRIRQEIDKSPYPVIVCGDFNDVPNSYVYETIGKGLQNAFEKKGAGLGRTFSGIAPTLRIDNIFADKLYQVDQYVRIKKN